MSFEVPDEIVPSLAAPDLNRYGLEALVLEAYRQRRLSAYQARCMLGIQSRYAFEAFLKEHLVEDYTCQDFEQDLRILPPIDEGMIAGNVRE